MESVQCPTTKRSHTATDLLTFIQHLWRIISYSRVIDCCCLTFTLSALSVQNQLSGYLLRKFKNSNGWQKLWVVFTNFCLFFYKTHQVSWPILGCINSAVVLVPNKGILTLSQVAKVCEVPVLRGVRNFLNKYRVVFHFCEENQMK